LEILEYADQRMYEFLPSVFGRVLLDGTHMTFFLVEIPPGKKVPLHHHTHEQMGICLAGEAEFVSKNQKRVVKKGMVYRFEPNEEHEVNVIGVENGLFLDVFSPPRSEYVTMQRSMEEHSQNNERMKHLCI